MAAKLYSMKLPIPSLSFGDGETGAQREPALAQNDGMSRQQRLLAHNRERHPKSGVPGQALT